MHLYFSNSKMFHLNILLICVLFRRYDFFCEEALFEIISATTLGGREVEYTSLVFVRKDCVCWTQRCLEDSL